MMKLECVGLFNYYIAPHLPFDCKEYLDAHGFFDAPASTKYHLSCPGGLFAHSLNVTKALVDFTEAFNLQWSRPESPYIVGFFHDLCKMDAYKECDGKFTHNPDTLLNGHGEKSVMLLSTLTQLTEEEVACIRYHMGAFTDAAQWNSFTSAIHKYPNVLWTHQADMYATHIMEAE